MTPSQTASTSFRRTHFTWLAYVLLGFFAYLQSVWGPIMPALRDELGLTFTQGGFHATAFAAGMVIAGSLGDALATRMGDHRMFWLGGAGMAGGALLLTVAPTVYMTVLSAFIMGIFGTLLLVLVQSGLANAHDDQRTTAISEANIVASMGAATVPLLVGGLQAVGLDWRLALVLAAAVWGSLWLWGRRISFPSAQNDYDDHDDDSTGRSLPAVFWLIWAGLVIGVAAEWSVTLWTADFMIAALAVDPALAAASVAIFAGAAVVGRWIASRLALRYSVWRILLLALGVALVGAVIMWQSRTLPLSVIALALMGLGVAGVYPLGVSAAIQVAPHNTNKASARASLGAAVAILVAPQTLGILADSMQIINAYGVIIVLIAAGLLLMGITARLTAQRD